MLLVPAAQTVGHQHGEDCEQAEPHHIALAERNDDRRRQQRAEGGAGVATDLEGRLRQAKTPTRGQPGNTRGFRVEGRRANTHQRRRQQNHRETADIGEHDNAHQGAQGAQRQQVRHRFAVGIETHPGLQQRGGDLERQGDHPDLGKGQTIVGLEQRVDRRQY
ncbi:hypothetical protein D3C79_754070 [compost metagenome]